MPSFLERFTDGQIETTGPRTGYTRLPRQTERALVAVDHRTLIRRARVQGEGLVQTEKVKELDHLAREAMTGQAMLTNFKNVLAGGDMFVAADLQYFAEMAKVGKGEVIADTVDSFCDESRSNR